MKIDENFVIIKLSNQDEQILGIIEKIPETVNEYVYVRDRLGLIAINPRFIVSIGKPEVEEIINQIKEEFLNGET